jgi:hypothetical protein
MYGLRFFKAFSVKDILISGAKKTVNIPMNKSQSAVVDPVDAIQDCHLAFKCSSNQWRVLPYGIPVWKRCSLLNQISRSHVLQNASQLSTSDHNNLTQHQQFTCFAFI